MHSNRHFKLAAVPSEVFQATPSNTPASWILHVIGHLLPLSNIGFWGFWRAVSRALSPEVDIGLAAASALGHLMNRIHILRSKRGQRGPSPLKSPFSERIRLLFGNHRVRSLRRDSRMQYNPASTMGGKFDYSHAGVTGLCAVQGKCLSQSVKE